MLAKDGGIKMTKNYTIAVAGTGYVGLSIATLLSQHHKVMAVDIVKEKVDLINNRKSPIQDDYIEKYLAEKNLNLTATLDAKEAYSERDLENSLLAHLEEFLLENLCKGLHNSSYANKFIMQSDLN